MILSQTDHITLSLLRNAISCTNLEKNEFLNLTNSDWREVFMLSQRQGVCAVVLEGIERLPAECRPPKNILLEWIGRSFAIENHYKQHLQLAKVLTGKWAESGIRTMVFKGLAHSRYYPIPSHREFGDFDCFLFWDKSRQTTNCIDAFERGNSLARESGALVNDEWYKHSKISYKGLTIENHRFFTATRSSKKAKELNAYIIDSLGDGASLKKLWDTEILLPTLEIEGLFMLYHSQMHFLVEGISLRHFVDWAYWIKANQNQLDWGTFYSHCKAFGIDSFAAVSNAIAEDWFGVVLNEGIERNKTYSEKVLLSTLHDDTLSNSKGNGRWHERFSIISNAFRYSWKFRDVVNYNMWEYLWSFIWGFILRKEDD